jgi:hypothetical protein
MSTDQFTKDLQAFFDQISTFVMDFFRQILAAWLF